MPRFDRTINLGHVLIAVSCAAGMFVSSYGSPGDYIRVEARTTANEKEQVKIDKRQTEAEQRQLEFQREIRQSFIEVRADLRALREDGGGVHWRDLPPSRYPR